MSRILLLVELKGGNDGLNTVIPYADLRYRQFRPGIGVARERTLQLDEKVGLHEKLAPLMDAWKAGDLAVVQGVGYPHPNRSHFRSIEIWDTAAAGNQMLNEGWVAQAFDGQKLPQREGVDSIVIDANSLPLMGPELRTIVMQDAENFLHQASALKGRAGMSDGGNPALRHLLAVRQEINAAAAGLSERLRDAQAPAHEYPNGPMLGRQLDLATRIVASGVPIVAIKVALMGFDTHANQVPVHENLLSVLANGLATFRKNMMAAGRWDDVLVMTYSEFGRRTRQNASGGTDHGAAAAHFILGGRVKGGLHGAQPSLSDLDDGDLHHTVDFRDVYSAVAEGCWGLKRSFGQRQVRPLAFV